MVNPVPPKNTFRPGAAKKAEVKAPAFSPTAAKFVPTSAKAPNANEASTAIGDNVPVEPWIRASKHCVALSNRDLCRVRNIIWATDITNTNTFLTYADDLHDQITRLLDEMSQLSTGNGQRASTLTKVQQALAIIQRVDASNLFTPKKISRWALLTGSITREEFDNYDKPNWHINRLTSAILEVELIGLDFETDGEALMDAVQKLDYWYDNSSKIFDALELHIIAGRVLVEKYVEREIPSREKDLDTNDIFEAQNLLYLKDSVNRFEKKIADLDLQNGLVKLKAPQIRAIQMQVKNEVQNMQRLTSVTIPNWVAHLEALRDLIERTSGTVQERFASIRSGRMVFIQELEQSQKELLEDFTK